MSENIQSTFFDGGERLQITESIEMTIQSLQTYRPDHPHWSSSTVAVQRGGKLMTSAQLASYELVHPIEKLRLVCTQVIKLSMVLTRGGSTLAREPIKHFLDDHLVRAVTQPLGCSELNQQVAPFLQALWICHYSLFHVPFGLHQRDVTLLLLQRVADFGARIADLLDCRLDLGRLHAGLLRRVRDLVLFAPGDLAAIGLASLLLVVCHLDLRSGKDSSMKAPSSRRQDRWATESGLRSFAVDPLVSCGFGGCLGLLARIERLSGRFVDHPVVNLGTGAVNVKSSSVDARGNHDRARAEDAPAMLFDLHVGSLSKGSV